MKKAHFSMIVAGILILALFMPIFSNEVESSSIEENTPDAVPMHPDDFIVDWWTFPEYPLGANWTTGLGGDIITVYVQFNSSYIDYAELTNAYCTDVCREAGQWWVMTYTGADNIWYCDLPGDWADGWDVYKYSTDSGRYTAFELYVENSVTWDYGVFPDEDGDGNYQPYDTWPHIYPAIPPTQINATSGASKTTMFVGETFTVSGASNFWPSTSYPNDFSHLIPALYSDVTVTVDGTPYTGKTDANGDYSIQVTAPVTPGDYKVNVTVSNSTPNRDVPCVGNEIDIKVNNHEMKATLDVSATTLLPEQPLWANGSIELDGAAASGGQTVNISIPGTNLSWEALTDANGDYSVQINAPNVTGTFSINATIYCSTYDIYAWNQTDITVVAVPLPDLVATGPGIKIAGNLVVGAELFFNVTISNTGIADAPNSTVNISLDGELLDSSVHDIAMNESVIISLDWTATYGIATNGTHNLTVEADPANTTEESSEVNNNAWKTFTLQSDLDGDGIGDAEDPDLDGDGVANEQDAFPQDPNESVDTDGDGTGDNADTDDDGDGVADEDDAFPENPDEWADFDGDGIGDNADPDDDNDGVVDLLDLFPYDGTESADYDGDGIGDNADPDDDADGLDDATDDPYPMDSDNDGLSNIMDLDDDNDGIPDTSDTMPFDTDNDGINNADDDDIDGDGVLNDEDTFPLDPEETIDTDGDGIGNNADNDDDDDGVPDDEDAFPLDPEASEPEAEEHDPSTTAVAAILLIGVVIVAIVLVYPGFKS